MGRKYTWDMTKKNFDQFKEAIASGKEGESYGDVYCGRFCAELTIASLKNEEANVEDVIGLQCFVLDKDTGYGMADIEGTDERVPYDCVQWLVFDRKFFDCTFTDLKKKLEKSMDELEYPQFDAETVRWRGSYL